MQIVQALLYHEVSDGPKALGAERTWRFLRRCKLPIQPDGPAQCEMFGLEIVAFQSVAATVLKICGFVAGDQAYDAGP